MATIDERNVTNQIKGVEAKLDQVQEEIKLQRVQLVGLLATMMLLGYGLYRLSKVIPA